MPGGGLGDGPAVRLGQHAGLGPGDDPGQGPVVPTERGFDVLLSGWG